MAYRCLERASRHRCARGPAGCIPTARIRLQTVEYTEYVHPRPGTGFADLLRRVILPERDADLTGIHIAVRSVQWIAWRSSSCSHRRRRHGLHQSRRSFDRTGTYRGMAARADWHSARFPIVWLVERIKDSRTTAATSKTATVHQARFLASQPQESKEEQDDKHEPTDTSSTGLGLS